MKLLSSKTQPCFYIHKALLGQKARSNDTWINATNLLKYYNHLQNDAYIDQCNNFINMILQTKNYEKYPTSIIKKN